MRKLLIFAPMLMLLLTACGGGQEKDEAEAIQEQYAAVESATLEAELTCHYAGEEREYTLLCAYTPESSTVTVMAPADLAGVSATVADGKLCLSYEDVSLDAGAGASAAASPVTALPKLMEAAATGYMTERSREMVGDRPCLRLSCDLPEDSGVLYTTWFDEEALVPLKSVVALDGAVVFDVSWDRFEVVSFTHPDDGVMRETPAETTAR